MRVNRQLLAVLAFGSFAAAAVAAHATSLVRNGEHAIFDEGGFVSQRSHAEVHAEAVAAAAAQPSRGDSDVESTPFVSTKTRAQVRAEAVEAQRLGLISHGESSAREATAADQELIRLAGQRARAAEDRLAGK